MFKCRFNSTVYTVSEHCDCKVILLQQQKPDTTGFTVARPSIVSSLIDTCLEMSQLMFINVQKSTKRLWRQGGSDVAYD